MTRIFLDIPLMNSSEIRVSGDKARYLTKVIRAVPGDKIIVIDPSSASFLAEISALTGRDVLISVQEQITLQTESSLEIILVQGLLKGDKMDYTIQKATELGVNMIIPAVTERSITRETRKTKRWRKIAEEASRQCGRQKIPMISDPLQFSGIIGDMTLAMYGKVMFWEEGSGGCSHALGELSNRNQVLLFTGPEGGFSAKEASAASEAGFRIVSLGKRILRAETAAIAAVAITQFVLGDLSGNSPAA